MNREADRLALVNHRGGADLNGVRKHCGLTVIEGVADRPDDELQEQFFCMRVQLRDFDKSYLDQLSNPLGRSPPLLVSALHFTEHANWQDRRKVSAMMARRSLEAGSI